MVQKFYNTKIKEGEILEDRTEGDNSIKKFTKI